LLDFTPDMIYTVAQKDKPLSRSFIESYLKRQLGYIFVNFEYRKRTRILSLC